MIFTCVYLCMSSFSPSFPLLFSYPLSGWSFCCCQFFRLITSPPSLPTQLYLYGGIYEEGNKEYTLDHVLNPLLSFLS